MSTSVLIAQLHGLVSSRPADLPHQFRQALQPQPSLAGQSVAQELFALLRAHE